MKLIYTIIFVFLGISQMDAQNALIYGKVTNTSYVKRIDMTVDHRFIDGNVDKYTSSVQDDQTFAFSIQIDRPQLVKLVYSRNVAILYIEPNDTLYVEADGNSFPYSISYGDKSGANNEFLRGFKQEFPKNQNEFEYTQYRSGLYWYMVPPKLDDMMQRMSKESYTNSLKARKDIRLTSLQDYDSKNPGQLTPVFKQYMMDEIYYEYAYYMYCYGDIFKNKHHVTKPFFDALSDIPVEGGKLGSFYYREFVKAYINHEYMYINKNDVNGIINKQYELAPNYLSGKALAYFRSEIIAKALYGKKVDVILDKYNDFQLNNTYYKFNDKITTAYQKAIKYHIGSPAPKFSLVAKDGTLASLDTYKGKPVFINFWASWCHSCMKKMDKMKSLQDEMEAKGMIFLNISFDRTEESWNGAIEKKGYGGVHVFMSEGVQSSMSEEYNVRALPQFFLVDKYGNFAKTPAKGDLAEMRQIMEDLLSW